MTLSWSLSNYETQNGLMQTQDIISRFLERKFCISHSYSTRNAYNAAIRKFQEFLRTQKNFDLSQMFCQILQRRLDPLEVLDEYHTFLSSYKTRTKTGYSSEAVNQYIIVAKDLMGHKSLKLVYYRQNDKIRAKTYLDVEHAVKISDTKKIDRDYSNMQKDNLELRGIVDSLSVQLRDLEKRIVVNN